MVTTVSRMIPKFTILDLELQVESLGVQQRVPGEQEKRWRNQQLDPFTEGQARKREDQI